MLSGVFHAWERRLASVSTDRVVRPFEWGLDWIAEEPSRISERLSCISEKEERDARVDGTGGMTSPGVHLERWADEMVAASDRFFALPPCDDFTLDGEWLTYPSAVETPHGENNLVRARYLPDHSPVGRKRAVIVLPQWNADADGHVGLCRLLNRFKISALRLSLPYHDERMPPELRRADYIVSSNVGRTAQVCRQAVLDARRGVEWLASQGYESIGILGTSLGSCLAMLTAAHEPRLQAAALNHISPYFADVVWSGLSTDHVRQGLDGHIDLESLRRIWMPISPYPYLDRVREKRLLLVYARYDLTFPVGLSRMLVDEFRRRGIEHQLAVLPCGHYSSGLGPFKWLDGLTLCRFLSKNL